jgi:hypothetical protein
MKGTWPMVREMMGGERGAAGFDGIERSWARLIDCRTRRTCTRLLYGVCKANLSSVVPESSKPWRWSGNAVMG